MRTRMTLVIVAGLASASVFAQSDKAVAYHEKPDTPAQYSSPDKPSAAIFPLNFQRRPSFSGGPLALLQFLGDHLTYPEVARRQGQEGIVRETSPGFRSTNRQVNSSMRKLFAWLRSCPASFPPARATSRLPVISIYPLLFPWNDGSGWSHAGNRLKPFLQQ